MSDILEACEVTLSEPEARECAAWTVLSLDYLHSNRKLHRVRTDIRVRYVLLTADTYYCTVLVGSMSTAFVPR